MGYYNLEDLAATITPSKFTIGTYPPIKVALSGVQQKLKDKGYNIGTAGVDGIWGSSSRSAFNSYIAANGEDLTKLGIDITPNIKTQVMNYLKSGGLQAAASIMPAMPLMPTELVYEEQKKWYQNPFVWILGGTVLLVGGFFVFKKLKKPRREISYGQ